MSVARWAVCLMLWAAPALGSTVTFEFDSGMMNADPDNGSAFQYTRQLRPTVTIDQSYLLEDLANSTLTLTFQGGSGGIRYSHTSASGTQSGSTGGLRAAPVSFLRSAPAALPFQTSMRGEISTFVQMTLDEMGEVTDFAFQYSGDCTSFGIFSDRESFESCYYFGGVNWASAQNGQVDVVQGAVSGGVGSLAAIPLPIGGVLMLSALGAMMLRRRFL